MNYPFDVDEAIRWLGELVDLIFVFFAPIGQVCCTFLFFYFFVGKQPSGPKYVLVQWPFDRDQRQLLCVLNYPFDVDEVILVDLIIVFFDLYLYILTASNAVVPSRSYFVFYQITYSKDFHSIRI